MAVKRKTPKSKNKPRKKASRFKKPKVSLPKKATKLREFLHEHILLIHGEKKIGKTTLAGQFPDPFFLFFEPGIGDLEVHQRPVTSWLEFVAYVDALEEDETFGTIVIDTVADAYERCFEHQCMVKGIDHPKELQYGEGWDFIKKEFKRQIMRLAHLDKGLIMIAHSKEVPKTGRKGQEYDKIVTSMSKQADEFCSGLADVLVYYGYEGEERVLTLSGSAYITAGCRLKHSFLQENGKKISQILCGNSEEETYERLVWAFNNELPEECMPARRSKKKKKSRVRRKSS